MLAALTGVHGLDRVPVIRRGDQHGINVFALQNIAVIAIRNYAGPAGLGILDGGFQPIIVRIANGGHADLSLLLEAQHVGQVRHAHAAHADVGDHEAAIRSRLRGPAQNAAGARLSAPAASALR